MTKIAHASGDERRKLRGGKARGEGIDFYCLTWFNKNKKNEVS